MVFSSVIFLFAFLPAIFLLYRVIPGLRAKNILLTVFSLIFYAFGNLSFLPLLLVSVLCNYFAGLLVARQGRGRKAALVGAVAVNLALLGVFKYTDFVLENLNLLFGLALPLRNIVLPIGISFFTFQGLSYVIDVYRDPASGTRRFGTVLLYIAFFPQLVAGPIVKYHDVAAQITCRTCTPEKTAQGVRRFICGLSKKLLLANTMGAFADGVFGLTGAELDFRLAWLGALSYALQIYFDFSAYSDMAIGLGHMFGFTFLENFRHPYAASSVRDFWRRWHISLSSWFRDYLYIPLGGNRKGVWRTRLNLLLVFFFTGLWHGASWTFVLWGLWHGLFRLAEQLLPERLRPRGAVGHVYTLLVAVLGFVLFRAQNLAQAGAMFRAMFTGFAVTAQSTALLCNLASPIWLTALAVCLVGSLPVLAWCRDRSPAKVRRVLEAATWPASVLLLLLDIGSLAASAFNPFIYFQF